MIKTHDRQGILDYFKNLEWKSKRLSTMDGTKI